MGICTPIHSSSYDGSLQPSAQGACEISVMKTTSCTVPTYGCKPPTSSYSPPAPGCWYVLPDLPNGLRSCLAQAPAYDQESKSVKRMIRLFRRDTDVMHMRDLYKGDLVQLIGHFTGSCGRG